LVGMGAAVHLLATTLLAALLDILWGDQPSMLHAHPG